MSYPTQRVVLFDGLAGTASTYTSNAALVADYGVISVSWASNVTNGTSRLTLQGSNDDGFASSIVNWSTLTAITQAGMYTIDAGARWMRAQRSVLSSRDTVSLQLGY